MINRRGIARRRAQRALAQGAVMGLSGGVLAEALITLFPGIPHVGLAPSLSAAAAALPIAGGVTFLGAAIAGIAAWLRRGRVASPHVGGTLIIPNLVEVAISGGTTTEPERNWAVFVDLSNIALGEKSGVNLTETELEHAIDWLEGQYGRLLVRQGYGDFSAGMRGAEALGLELRRRGFTLTHLPRLQKGAEKNHSDIQMAVDAALIARQRPDIGGVIIMSGDGDFMPLAVQLRTVGKRVHVIARDSAISPALLAQADEVVLLETITGRATPMSPTALRQAVTRLRGALSGLAGQGIATPLSMLPIVARLVGVDVVALGFANMILFQNVMTDLGLLRLNKTPQGEIVMPGETEPGKDTLDRLLKMMSLSLAEFAKRKQRPSLIQVLEPIWKTEPDLDVTKKTPLVAIQILTIAERLNIATIERKPGEENKVLPGKAME